MQKNYKSASDIAKELENVDLENFLDFDSKDGFEFDSCDYCNGPELRDLEVKFPRIEYELEMVRKFEKHLRKNEGLRNALTRRGQKKPEREEALKIKLKEVEAKAMAEVMRNTYEGLGVNTQGGNAQGTTQIVK